MTQLDFRGLMDAAGDVIAVLDRAERYVYVNAALERATGVPAAMLVGKRSDEGMTPEEAAEWHEGLEDVLRSGRKRAIGCTIATPDGPRRFASVVTRMSGDLVCAVMRDITDVCSDRPLGDKVERCAGKPSHPACYLSEASALGLERSLLLEAERRARADAEAARQRERQLHVLAARLSSALTPPQVAAIACEEVVSVLHAYSSAASIHQGDGVRILGTGGLRDEAALARVAQVPLSVALPLTEAIRTGELVWCVSEGELAARYPHFEDIWRRLGIRSWGAVPFRFEGGTVGALALSFTTERELGPEDRAFLAGVGQLTAQAFERARLRGNSMSRP